MDRHADTRTMQQSPRRSRVKALALCAATLAGAASAAIVAAPTAGAATVRPAASATCRAGTITVSGPSGHIGQAVVVSGCGWWAPVPGEGLGGVTVNFPRHGSNSAVTTVVSARGFFQVTLPIKKGDALDPNRVIATEESGCGGTITYPSAHAAFTIK